MKIILNTIFYILSVYAFMLFALMYGVAMGFVASDSQDLLSQSVRAIIHFF